MKGENSKIKMAEQLLWKLLKKTFRKITQKYKCDCAESHKFVEFSLKIRKNSIENCRENKN